MSSTPPLDEFIDLSHRRSTHGFPSMAERVTVAVYNTSKGFQTLTIRIGDKIAERLGMSIGDRMTCLVHPDQTHMALVPAKESGHRAGAVLFQPRNGRSTLFQTTLRGGTLDPQKATEAAITRSEDGVYIITLRDGGTV